MQFAETQAEARLRAAWLLRRSGHPDRALATLDAAHEPSPDRQVRYLGELVRGEILRALGREADAAAALRSALAEWPGAQSARVALMTLLVRRGERAEAASLAEAIETASDEQFDPWWMSLARRPAPLSGGHCGAAGDGAMMPRLLFLTVLAIALAVPTTHGAVAQTTAAQEPQRTFRATADVVSVEVSVRRDKRTVVGLVAADFNVLDNGVAQQIDTVSYERLPIDVTIALDVSASVTGPVLEQLRRSVRQLQTDLSVRDRLKLLVFNMRVLRLMDFRPSSPANDVALASLPAAGSSAIFDTLAVTLTAAPSAGRRQLIIVFTDGKDSASITDADLLVDVARRSTPTIAVVLKSAAPEEPASTFGRVPFPAIRELYRPGRHRDWRRRRLHTRRRRLELDVPPRAV